MTWKKVEALPLAVGNLPIGQYPVYQAHQTRSQWLAPHYSAATVMTTAYWMFQVFSTFSSSALAAAARAGPTAYLCVTGTEQVSGSSQGCQVVPEEYRESRRGVQRGQCQWPVRQAGGGADRP